MWFLLFYSPKPRNQVSILIFLKWLTEHLCAYWYFLRCENHFPSVENSVSDNNRDNSLNSFKRRTNYEKGNTRPYLFDVNVRFVIRKKNFSRKSRIVLEDLPLNNDLRWWMVSTFSPRCLVKFDTSAVKGFLCTHRNGLPNVTMKIF